MSPMPPRSIATATISFGLVTIPVKLFPATQAQAAGVSFHMLHRECGSRLKQQYICSRDEVVVPRDDIIKGYEFAKDQYVTFTTEELKALEEKSTQTVDISEFVPLDKVDPVYFDKPYYLAPDKGGEKAYHLLSEVMRETGRCALARYAARGKQYLVMIRPIEGGLAMQQLLYADEVRSFKEVGLPDKPALREAELKLAEQLVEQISVQTFDPTQYEDEVKKRIQADIQKKVEGKEIDVSEPTEAPAQVIDLMEALKASLGAAKGRRPPAASGAEDDGEERRPAQTARGKAEKGAARRSESKRAARR
jgi:DNA end-binding protein Ku